MKIIKNGYEKKYVCPKCESILLFNTKKDKVYATGEGVAYFNCPVCNKSIVIEKTTKIEEVV